MNGVVMARMDHSRSYHGRILAPFRSMPSVSMASTSGASLSFVCPSPEGFGHEKVPFSNR
jgi:hypothetical protein